MGKNYEHIQYFDPMWKVWNFVVVTKLILSTCSVRTFAVCLCLLVLGLQMCAGLHVAFMWRCGSKLRSSCWSSKPFIHLAISLVPCFVLRKAVLKLSLGSQVLGYKH